MKPYKSKDMHKKVSTSNSALFNYDSLRIRCCWF